MRSRWELHGGGLLAGLLLLGAAACEQVAGVDFGAAKLGSDVVTPTPGNGSTSLSCDATCADLGWECGSPFDACGAPRDCGACPEGRACDAGKCVCVKRSCAELGVACGAAPDGCGGVLECGGCVNPSEACVDGQCRCQPKTCAEQDAICGTVPDGCGSQYACGDCATAPEGPECGGGGPNKCGATPCVPKTCAELGKNCGTASDGCGGVLACGECTAPATCGGDGTANVCGCKPTTCALQGRSCGSLADGCGGTLDCGGCTAPSTCGGGGTAGACGCTSNGSCSTTCGTGVDNCGRTCTRNTGCGGGGGGGGGGCFARGTLVRMADGTHRPIETLRIGDMVASYDRVARTMTAARVVATPVHGPESSANGFVVVRGGDGGGAIRVTPNHPILIDGVELPADALHAGSRVLVPGAPKSTPASLVENLLDVAVRSRTLDVVERQPGNGESTYDLRLEGGSGYFVGPGDISILVQLKEAIP